MSQHEKRRVYSHACWVAGILMLLAGIFYFEPNATYQGQTLPEYLMAFSADGHQVSSEPPYELVGVFQPSVERTAAWEALPHFGDEALPNLVKLVGAKDSSVRRALHRLASKLTLLNLRIVTASEKQQQAVTAFIYYGSRAASIGPQLAPMLEDPLTARAAIFSLAFIKPNGELYVKALTDTVHRFDGSVILQVDAMAALGMYGPRAVSAAPELRKYLNSTNDQVSATAAVVLSRIGEQTAEDVNLIAGRLRGASRFPGYMARPLDMYLWALGESGSVAKQAIPIIAGFTNDASENLRRLAEEAVRRIDRSAEPSNAPNYGHATPAENSDGPQGAGIGDLERLAETR